MKVFARMSTICFPPSCQGLCKKTHSSPPPPFPLPLPLPHFTTPPSYLSSNRTRKEIRCTRVSQKMLFQPIPQFYVCPAGLSDDKHEDGTVIVQKSQQLGSRLPCNSSPPLVFAVCMQPCAIGGRDSRGKFSVKAAPLNAVVTCLLSSSVQSFEKIKTIATLSCLY